FFFSSRRRHTRFSRDWSSDVCSSDLEHDQVERVGDKAGKVDGFAEHGELEALEAFEDHYERAAVCRNIFPGGKGEENDQGAYIRSEERRVGKESILCL